MAKLSEIIRDEESFYKKVEEVRKIKTKKSVNTDITLEEQEKSFSKFTQTEEGAKAIIEEDVI